LYVDEKNDFYIVFCREWTQVINGQICVAKVCHNFSKLLEEPKVLFHGSDAKWAKRSTKTGSNRKPTPSTVTDGPYVFKSRLSGELLMIWSTIYSETRLYCVGIARSSGSIYGPWYQDEEPIFIGDGGHGMIFREPSGDLVLSLHVQNANVDKSHPRLFRIEETISETTGKCELLVRDRLSSPISCLD